LHTLSGRKSNAYRLELAYNCGIEQAGFLERHVVRGFLEPNQSLERRAQGCEISGCQFSIRMPIVSARKNRTGTPVLGTERAKSKPRSSSFIASSDTMRWDARSDRFLLVRQSFQQLSGRNSDCRPYSPELGKLAKAHLPSLRSIVFDFGLRGSIKQVAKSHHQNHRYRIRRAVMG